MPHMCLHEGSQLFAQDLQVMRKKYDLYLMYRDSTLGVGGQGCPSDDSGIHFRPGAGANARGRC